MLRAGKTSPSRSPSRAPGGQNETAGKATAGSADATCAAAAATAAGAGGGVIAPPGGNRRALLPVSCLLEPSPWPAMGASASQQEPLAPGTAQPTTTLAPVAEESLPPRTACMARFGGAAPLPLPSGPPGCWPGAPESPRACLHALFMRPYLLRLGPAVFLPDPHFFCATLMHCLRCPALCRVFEMSSGLADRLSSDSVRCPLQPYPDTADWPPTQSPAHS